MAAKSYRDIIGFVNVAARWIEAHKGESGKFEYAVSKLAKRLSKQTTDFQEQAEDLNVEHCAVNEKGHILHETNGDYVFTRDGRKARDAARRKLLDTEVVVEPFLVKAEHIPEDLPADMRVMFEGFVIPEGDAE